MFGIFCIGMILAYLFMKFYIYLNLSSLPVAGRTGRKMSEATRWEAFRSLDKNRDGALTADELEAEIFVPRRLDDLDPDPDG